MQNFWNLGASEGGSPFLTKLSKGTSLADWFHAFWVLMPMRADPFTDFFKITSLAEVIMLYRIQRNTTAFYDCQSFGFQGYRRASGSYATILAWKRSRRSNTWTARSPPAQLSQSPSSLPTVRRRWPLARLSRERRTTVLTFRRLSHHPLTSPPQQPRPRRLGGCLASCTTPPPAKSGKVNGKMWICIAPCRDHTSKALRYSTRSQGISQCEASYLLMA